MGSNKYLAFALCLACCGAGAKLAGADPSACARLTDLKIAETTITAADLVPAGSFKVASPGQNFTAPDLPEFCRVQAVTRPTPDSEIRLEVWMPTSTWNGRFEQVGNGGYAGGIAYGFMAPQLQRGFATASTDDGHRSENGNDWIIGHPEKVIDFGYRAVHETSVKAKTIIDAFYGKQPEVSYFNGCSDGGREALMEAQRFPDDFKGIIVGAPANFWTHLMTGFVWDEQVLLDDPASYIPASKLPALQAAALAACDALDGVKDGLLEDPSRCQFDPAVLTCEGADGVDCLTPAQVAAARKIYAGPNNPRTGKQIFPGYAPGAEAGGGNWPAWIVGKLPNGGFQFSFGNVFFAHMVFERPQWEFRTLNFDSDVTLADTKMASILNSTNPDLRRFQARGGKLIQYHGWADAAISPANSINYYQSVVGKMGGLEKTKAFYRLYMVPAMSHCAGGAGPNSFGAIIQPPTHPADAENDVVQALTRWVESGVAPGSIIATKYKDDDPKKGVVMTRPLCPYPQHAKWTGSGSVFDAANFICK